MTGICNWKEAISRLGPPNSTQKNNSPKFLPYIRFYPLGALRPVTPLSTIRLPMVLAVVHILDLFFLFIQVTPLSGTWVDHHLLSIRQSIKLLLICLPSPSHFYIQSINFLSTPLDGDKPTLLLPGNPELWLSVPACLSFPSICTV
jgi:hypothetical protein